MTGIFTDFYDLEAALSPAERAGRDGVRDFIATRAAPHLTQWWRDGNFPRGLATEMGKLGVLGPLLPKAYGGTGISPLGYGLMLTELEHGDSSLRSFASVQGGLVMEAIARFGSDEQKARLLPGLAQGNLVGCFALTEAEAGSDPGAMQTSARRVPGGWEISGHKRWITNGHIADWAVIWARAEESDTVTGFLIPCDSPGFTAHPIRDKGSMRISATSTVDLDAVRVTEDHRLPLAEGLKAPLACLTEARYGIAWGVVGAALDAMEEAMQFAQQRRSFGRPIAATQLVQERLVEMQSRVAQMQLVAFQLAELKRTGRLRFPQVSLAKRDNARSALMVARLAREILGAAGVSFQSRTLRHMANLESVDTYEGTYEIQTLIVGRELTGFPAF